MPHEPQRTQPDPAVIRQHTQALFAQALIELLASHAGPEAYTHTAMIAAGMLDMIGRLVAPPGVVFPEHLTKLVAACAAAVTTFRERMDSRIITPRGIVG